MVHLYSKEMLDGVDLSPFYSGNSNTLFDVRSPSTSLSSEWMRSPTSEISEYTSLSSADGFTSTCDSSYCTDYFSIPRETRMTNDGTGGSPGRNFVEQCTAEQCFFGCGGHTPAAPNSLGLYMSLPKAGSDSSDLFEIERERAFGKPFALASDLVPQPRYHPLLSANDSFDSFFGSSGLGCHERRASVPSFPTQTMSPRHRRLSEPFNALISRTSSSPSPRNDIVPARSPIRKEYHSPPKSKDHPKPILFKTELCRSWEEKGSCRYGYLTSFAPKVIFRNKCQFAHSTVELRPVPRHPKYKTQLCRTFLEVSLC